MNLASLGSFSSLATNALDTARSTFKGLADAASSDAASSGSASAGAAQKAPAAAEKTEGQVETTATKPKGVRLGTVLDAYA